MDWCTGNRHKDIGKEKHIRARTDMEYTDSMGGYYTDTYVDINTDTDTDTDGNDEPPSLSKFQSTTHHDVNHSSRLVDQRPRGDAISFVNDTQITRYINGTDDPSDIDDIDEGNIDPNARLFTSTNSQISIRSDCHGMTDLAQLPTVQLGNKSFRIQPVQPSLWNYMKYKGLVCARTNGRIVRRFEQNTNHANKIGSLMSAAGSAGYIYNVSGIPGDIKITLDLMKMKVWDSNEKYLGCIYILVEYCNEKSQNWFSVNYYRRDNPNRARLDQFIEAVNPTQLE